MAAWMFNTGKEIDDMCQYSINVNGNTHGAQTIAEGEAYNGNVLSLFRRFMQDQRWDDIDLRLGHGEGSVSGHNDNQRMNILRRLENFFREHPERHLENIDIESVLTEFRSHEGGAD